MKKTVILLWDDGSVCSVYHVANPDDGLIKAVAAAKHEWNATEEGCGADIDSFVLKYLADRGYEVRNDTDFDCV